MNSKPMPDASARPMCAGQVIGTFQVADGGGGAQRLAYNLAAGLGKHGLRSLAIALRSENRGGNLAAESMKLIEFGANPRKPLSLVKAFLGLRRLIREYRIDLLHVHGAPSLPFVALAILGVRHKPRLVFTWQDSESVLDKAGWRTRLMVWALRRCDAVSGSSRDVAQKLAHRAALRQVGVFHGGVPISPEHDVESTKAPLILWLGRLVPPKDPQILIRAAACLRTEGYKFSLCIVGEPHPGALWYMKEIRALIDKLRMEEIVQLPGFVPDEELKKIMNRAEISVQTSHTEGMSIALMEHMMFGLAIVATDVGDTAIAIEDGVSGIVIPPKDERRLTDALRQLLADRQLRKRLGAAARKRAVDRFSIPAMVRRAADEYSALVERT